MSIIRVGLAETKKFAEGYEAIFGKAKEDGAEANRSRTGQKPAAAQVAAAKPKKKAKRK